MDDQILSLEHISLSYHTMKGETPALCDLTFSVTPGDFVALVGPSGCGKSTILNLISGLLKPEAGTLLSRGRPITEADLHIGYMLQRDHLFEWRTIYSNVLLGLEISRTLTPERKEKVGEMMETYGLKSFSNARPSELSGGMRQRAALIRTLAMEPDLLLLDEPFSALDYQTRLNVCDDIGKIIKKEGKTAILVTHDISEAISMADRVIVLAARPAYVKKKIPMYDNLTKDDIKKMQEEIEYRKLVVRKEALEAVKEARAQGDLSENFEYKAAKQDKNRNESRIRYLEKMIKTARIVSDESKSDEVGLGDRVELYIPEDDETESYKLVTTVRGNSMKGLISIDSPLGKAIKGRKTGDKVYIKVNDTYGYEAEIRSIDKTAKEEEDQLRSY